MGQMEERMRAVGAALGAHMHAKGAATEEWPAAVTDLLTDIRHYCKACDIDFAKCARLAADHYRAETPKRTKGPFYAVVNDAGELAARAHTWLEGERARKALGNWRDWRTLNLTHPMNAALRERHGIPEE